jgi:hypothetical protein
MLVGELWPGVGSVPGCDGCGATSLPPTSPYSSLAASLLLSCKYYTVQVDKYEYYDFKLHKKEQLQHGREI